MLDQSTSELLNQLTQQPTPKMSVKSWPTIFIHGAGTTAHNELTDQQRHSLKNSAEATVDELLSIMKG